ncbi:DUF4143 domain-containing protein [Niabella aurantiaca]|uniref:DUF4143 domain-containing protein n=1 Tax=Niabella aurantiaca TaxID=379900 RepID=UPI0003729D91|nr:DUF4143 domain-containing protein [Niabella aurantiaca]
MKSETVDQYIYLPEQVFLVHRLTAFARNLHNEINRKRKVYFYDNGIRNAVTGDYKLPALCSDRSAGNLPRWLNPDPYSPGSLQNLNIPS